MAFTPMPVGKLAMSKRSVKLVAYAIADCVKIISRNSVFVAMPLILLFKRIRKNIFFPNIVVLGTKPASS